MLMKSRGIVAIDLAEHNCGGPGVALPSVVVCLMAFRVASSVGFVDIVCAGVFNVGFWCVTVSDVVASSEVTGVDRLVRLDIELIGDVFNVGDDDSEERGGVLVGSIPVKIVCSAVFETFS